jgi:pilus assembly protein CpaF
MFLIAPTCDILRRALIANALCEICADKDGQSVILDLSVASTEAFWSMYKDGAKFIEDIIPVMAGLNSKTLKKYLSPMNENLTLSLKNMEFADMDFEKIFYLIKVLEENYKYVFTILPDENNSNVFKLIRNARFILAPYISDTLSARRTLKIVDLYSSLCSANSKIIPLRLNINHEFHCGQILKDNAVFSKELSADFTFKFQEEIIYPQYSYKNNSNSFILALSKAVEIYNLTAQKTDDENIADSYFRNKDVYKDLCKKIHKELVDNMKNYSDQTDSRALKEIAETKIRDILSGLEIKIPSDIQSKLIKELCDNAAGFGVLEDLIDNPAITEIMVNGSKNIYIEKDGKIIESGIAFPNEENLKTVIERIAACAGRHIDEASPIVDSRLKDGSRVNAVIKPIALNGHILTIRKFMKNKLSIESLIEAGALSAQMAEFLKAAVILRKNMIISGGTGTGKTTLLNAVSNFIPQDERLITIEDSAELQLQQKHTVRLEARPKSSEGTGEISIRRLVINALRMRPDRIIVGECRAGEALDMLQAMNTGHEGSMSTVHANSEKDAVSRLETMVLMSGAELPAQAIISQILSAVNVIVQLTRYFDGTRKISSISAIEQNKEEEYEIKKIFEFKLAGIKNSKQLGEFRGCNTIPSFIKTASLRGINIDEKIFT